MRTLIALLAVLSLLVVPPGPVEAAAPSPARVSPEAGGEARAESPAAHLAGQEQQQEQEGEQENREGDEEQQQPQQSEFEAQVKAQLEEIRGRLAPSFSESSGAVIGELGEGEAHGFGFQAEAGKGYAVIGVCDIDCGNLDLVLYTEDGEEITADRQPDDIPLLRFAPREDANVVVEIHMTLCTAETCVLGVQVFARDMEIPEEDGDDGSAGP